MEVWNLPVMLYRLALESALWRPVPGLGEDGTGLEWLSPVQSLLHPAQFLPSSARFLPSPGQSLTSQAQPLPSQANTPGPLPVGGGALSALEQMPAPEAVLPLAAKNILPEEGLVPPSGATAGRAALPQPEEGSAPARLPWPEAGQGKPWKLPGEPEGGDAMAAAVLMAAAALEGGDVSPILESILSPAGQEETFWSPAPFQAGGLAAAALSQPSVGGAPSDTGPSSSGEILFRLLREGARPQNQPVRVTTQAPVIQVTGQNTGNTAADRVRLAQAIRDVLVEQINGSAARPGARIW